MTTIDLKDILAISGSPGLYRFIKQGRQGVIVESLNTHKKTNVHETAKISTLEDITIFTEEGEEKLGVVMKSIYDKENGGKTISPKSPADKLKAYFTEILPEYDEERVYNSDIKKILSWYNALHDLNMLEVKEEEEESGEDTNEDETGDETKETGEADNKE